MFGELLRELDEFCGALLRVERSGITCASGRQGGRGIVRPVAGRGGPGVRTPPEPFRITFPNRVNPVSFLQRGGGKVRVRVARVRARAAIAWAPEVVWLVCRLPHQFEMWCGRDIIYLTTPAL